MTEKNGSKQPETQYLSGRSTPDDPKYHDAGKAPAQDWIFSSADECPDTEKQYIWLQEGERDNHLRIKAHKTNYALLDAFRSELVKAHAKYFANEDPSRFRIEAKEDNLFLTVNAPKKGDSDKAFAADLLNLAKDFRSAALTGARPVKALRANFFMPVRFKRPPKIDKNIELDEFPVAAAKYFAAYMPEERLIEPANVYTLAENLGQVVIITAGFEHPKVLNISAFRLHRAESLSRTIYGAEQGKTSLGLIEIELTMPASTNGQGKALSTAEAIEALAESRFAYIGHCRKSINVEGTLVANEVTWHLKDTSFKTPMNMEDEAVPDNAEQFKQSIFAKLAGQYLEDFDSITHLLDNRARGFVSLCLEGDAPPCWADEFHAPLRHRLAELDPFGAGFDYDFGFSKADLPKQTYNRFAGFGTYYLTNTHNFAALTYGSFGYEEIHKKHMPEIYRFMWVFTLLRLTGQFELNRQLNNIKRDGVENAYDEIVSVKSKILDFGQLYMPKLMSTEVQGQELWEHIQRQTEIEKRHSGMLDQIAQLENHLHMKSAERASDISTALKVVLLPLTIFWFLIQIGSPPFAPWWEYEYIVRVLQHFEPLGLGLLLVIISLLGAQILSLVLPGDSWWQACGKLFGPRIKNAFARK